MRNAIYSFYFTVIVVSIFLPQKAFPLISPIYTGYSQDTAINRKPDEKLRTYTTMRLTTPKPVIDGKLDDDCWKTGEWAGDFIQFVPKEGAKPSLPTKMKILYDDKNIYVAMRAYDNEPDKIQRYAGMRDEFVGDIMGVTFDSYHDRRTGFEFDLTAYGQKIDLVLTNPMAWDGSWNPVWAGKPGMEDSAWVVEMEIPLSQLRYSIEDEQVWGLHCWRWIGRYLEESDWEKQSLTGPGVLYNFGELHGISSLKKSERLEIMPYSLGKLTTFAKEQGNPFAKQGRTWNGNLGLDAKIGLSSNFTMDLTVNPDFGQVESDPSVMNLTAFETFYEEKRPFFLEGKTIFNYGIDDLSLFYSRRIGHSPSYSYTPADNTYIQSPDQTTILDAIKLSGKTADGLSVGLIQSLTAPEYARLDDGAGRKDKLAVEPLTNYGVARIQKDYNKGTTMLGGMLTSTNRFIQDANLNFLSRNAYAGGLDLLHQWRDKKYFIDARLVGSYIQGSALAIQTEQESSARYFQRPGAEYLKYDTSRTQLGGYGGKFKIGKGSGLWRYNAAITWLSPGLELNDLGYMQSSDEIRQESNISYFVIRPVSIFRTYTVNLEQFNTWNFNGSYLGSGAHLSFSSEFMNKWSFQTNLIGHTHQLDTRILRGGPDMLLPGSFLTFGQLRTDYSRKISFGVEYNYQLTASQSAENYSIGPSFTIRPVNTLKVSLAGSYAGNHDQLQYITTRNLNAGSRYIMGTIDQRTMGLTLRIDYSITPEFTIQYYGSPFISRGSYAEFKYVEDPLNPKYKERFTLYPDPAVENGIYQLDENNDGVGDYTLENPDFNFHQFRSNLVAKWEYRPGSYIYLVWSSERTGNADVADATLGQSFRQMWNVFPGNIFLIKFNYWFSL
jgi:hypothetical protein